jgi:hypothetical protein
VDTGSPTNKDVALILRQSVPANLPMFAATAASYERVLEKFQVACRDL